MTTPTTRKLCAALIVSSFLLGTSGCGTATPDTPATTAATGDWWNNPGDIRDSLASVGSAKLMGNLSNARTRAETDARAKLAASGRAKLQQLVQNWAKEAGDMLDEKTVSSYINDETLTRQLVDEELVGARPVRYQTEGEYVYALMIMDDPANWTKRVGSSLRDRAVKDETLFKTEVMKQDFEKKLDALINRDADAASKSKANFEKAYVK